MRRFPGLYRRSLNSGGGPFAAPPAPGPDKPGTAQVARPRDGCHRGGKAVAPTGFQIEYAGGLHLIFIRLF